MVSSVDMRVMKQTCPSGKGVLAFAIQVPPELTADQMNAFIRQAKALRKTCLGIESVVVHIEHETRRQKLKCKGKGYHGPHKGSGKSQFFRYYSDRLPTRAKFEYPVQPWPWTHRPVYIEISAWSADWAAHAMNLLVQYLCHDYGQSLKVVYALVQPEAVAWILDSKDRSWFYEDGALDYTAMHYSEHHDNKNGQALLTYTWRSGTTHAKAIYDFQEAAQFLERELRSVVRSCLPIREDAIWLLNRWGHQCSSIAEQLRDEHDVLMQLWWVKLQNGAWWDMCWWDDFRIHLVGQQREVELVRKKLMGMWLKWPPLPNERLEPADIDINYVMLESDDPPPYRVGNLPRCKEPWLEGTAVLQMALQLEMEFFVVVRKNPRSCRDRNAVRAIFRTTEEVRADPVVASLEFWRQNIEALEEERYQPSEPFGVNGSFNFEAVSIIELTPNGAGVPHSVRCYWAGRPSILRTLRTALSKELDISRKVDVDMERIQASLLPRSVSTVRDFSVHDVPRSHPKFRFVENLVEQTVASHREEIRSPVFCPAPVLSVVSVQEIVNSKLVNRYIAALDDIQQKRQPEGCRSIPQLANLKLSSMARCAGEADLNEHFAFHGCTTEVRKTQIFMEGFDPQRGGEGAGRLFGVASYFAANISKADIYTDELGALPSSRAPRNSPRQVILARLCLGKSFRTLTPHRDWHRAPDGYDSVWADCLSEGGCVDHREMMVYKEQQALPLFLVTYVHECPQECLCAECRKRPTA